MKESVYDLVNERKSERITVEATKQNA